MVVTVEFANFSIHRALIDQESPVDTIYRRAFNQLKLPTSVIKPYKGNLVGLSGASTSVTRYLNVLITFRANVGVKKVEAQIHIVESNSLTDSTYNMIIGRPITNAMGEIVSIPYWP